MSRVSNTAVSREFVIQPNCSLSPQGRQQFLWGIGAVMLLITLGLMTMGFWLIAPFMGADIALLAYAFAKVGQNCRIVERVVIQDDALTIHHEEKKHPCTWSFPVHWVRVDLRQAVHPWYRTRLLIGSQGRWIELATFLNNDERATLADALKAAILTARQPQWEGIENAVS